MYSSSAKYIDFLKTKRTLVNHFFIFNYQMITKHNMIIKHKYSEIYVFLSNLLRKTKH